MAVGTYELTHKKILESGMSHFLKNGFERTNLRDLCKDAGITTGAFYRHFTDKEGLFSELVDPAFNGLHKIVANAEGQYFGSVPNQNFGELWHDISEETISKFIEYIYRYRNEFKLLLYCSDGTKYVDFIDTLVERELQDTQKLYEMLIQHNVSFHKINEKEEHMLNHAFYSSLFECIIHDYGEEEASQYAKTITAFFSAGWRSVHGI